MAQRKKLRLVYELAILLLALILLAVLLFQLGYWLMPERTTYGAVWSSYLQEETNSVDLLILGSSRAYCDLIPAGIYRKTGVSSYCMCGPSQTAAVTYYYLRECLRTQKPKYVFVEASGLWFGRYEDQSKSNVVYMPGSINRVLAGAACEAGILELALYPLEEFHYRIYSEDLHAPPAQDGVMLCGYTPLADAKPQTERGLRIPKVEPGNETYLHHLDSFRRIAELCDREGIECIFFLTPTMLDYTEAQTARMLTDLRGLPCRAVEDWTDLIAEIGIDNETDWLDSIHFNQRGAEKFTDFFSDYLLELGVEPSPDADAELWQRRWDYLHSAP